MRRVSSAESADKAEPFTLNGEQQAAFEGLSALLGHEGGSAALLYGVTASGKTQVYLKLIEETLRRGRSAMLLVPEIALTPQMMQRFSAQFGPDVVMLHSALPLTERYDQWKRIRRGEVRVVLGTRSAVFAPLPDLGLIILDEEQEGSYQSENPPHYHARDIAQFRCAQHGALMLLGSATPTVETAYYAKHGRCAGGTTAPSAARCVRRSKKIFRAGSRAFCFSTGAAARGCSFAVSAAMCRSARGAACR